MKKTYIIPVTDVITYKMNQMLASSPKVDIDPNDPGVDPEEFDARRKSGFGNSMWSDMK